MSALNDSRLPPNFWSKVQEDSKTGCWRWQAAKTSGYGSFGVGCHRTALAHRVAYETLIGPVPDGMELDHLCRVRECCNPEHLEPVTHSENCARSPLVGKWKLATTHCPRGHEYNDENTYYDRRRNKRQCRACGREAQREYQRRKRAAEARI